MFPSRDADKHIMFCDGQMLKYLIKFGLSWLRRFEETINAVNVFPAPDGDTGTNMSLTMQSAYREIRDSSEVEVDIIAQKLAHGTLMAARGNSGVILSQVFRGFAHSMEGLKSFNTIQFASALSNAAAAAYRSTKKPVEGTILTVVREIADEAATAAAKSNDIHYLFEQIVHEARASVIRTPKILQAVADAGVVDAGAQAFGILLEGMLRYLKGERVAIDAKVATSSDFHPLHVEAGEDYGYDIQFIIHGDNLNVGKAREAIDSMGESVLVVGDSNIVKVHVHSREPGPPINYGAGLGSLSRVIVENMQKQYEYNKSK